MTSVSYYSSRSRPLILLALIVALHYAVIAWLTGHMGESPERSPLPRMVEIELLPALAARPTRPAAPPRERPPPPRPRKPIPPPPAPDLQPAPPVAPAVLEAGLDLAAPVTADTEGATAAGAIAAATPAVQPGAVPAAADVQSPAADAAPPPQGGRRYKVDLPPSAGFELDVKRVDPNGTKWNGSAAMRWQSDGSRYKVGLEVGITVLIARVNLLALDSEGSIDDAGIAPQTMREKRRGRSQTATHFNREQRHISFSASEAKVPLLAGAQDKASVPFQLAAIGRADVKQFDGDIDILVGEDKGASVYRFQLAGEEELDTAIGKLQAWRLTRPPKPGSYSARLDIWLAPTLGWYPVQIRNTEANGAVTTQTVTRITQLDSTIQ
ncbi:DUF3108 domain-containing protein [Massilia sp. YIM B04103]|uniref:DUF3108 domain-containing protein n=1 Tax=Massilia sp. YIM B04103 TaxID=2963106 RepID=UPI00210A4AF2|nr:DUF3108 domain-containing protein [Massilia sp. YIM B04103]